MIIEHYIGLVIFLFISFAAIISAVGWIKADSEAKKYRKANAKMRKDIIKLLDDLAGETSWASIVNLEVEDK